MRAGVGDEDSSRGQCRGEEPLPSLVISRLCSYLRSSSHPGGVLAGSPTPGRTCHTRQGLIREGRQAILLCAGPAAPAAPNAPCTPRTRRRRASAWFPSIGTSASDVAGQRENPGSPVPRPVAAGLVRAVRPPLDDLGRVRRGRGYDTGLSAAESVLSIPSKSNASIFRTTRCYRHAHVGADITPPPLHFPGANRHARSGRLWRCSTLGLMYHRNVATPNATHSTLTM